MRKCWTALTTLLLAVSLAACNQTGARQDANVTYAQIRESFQNQQAFSFYGQTKLLTGDTASGNVVNFSGRKQGNDLYMDVKLSFPEQKRVDTMSLMTRGEQLYAKAGGERQWRSVNGQDRSLRQELNNWNPVFNFQQMDEMKASVMLLDDKNREDNLGAIRVLLDSSKLKNWLAGEMKQLSGAHIQAAHVPRVKLAMSLSEALRMNRPGASIQSSQPNVDEIVDQMELEAEYTIYYDQTTYLPTSMVMSIRSEYDLNDQRIQEHSQVETFVRDYGNRLELPDPAKEQAVR